MKTAISIPDDVFSRAERFAHRLKITRSALFTAAVDEYIQHHRDDDVTQKLNDVYACEDSSLDPVFAHLQSLSLPKEKW
jgi:metal-responsive CopG/Arc/MetJ family transcriptional regulator